MLLPCFPIMQACLGVTVTAAIALPVRPLIGEPAALRRGTGWLTIYVLPYRTAPSSRQ